MASRDAVEIRLCFPGISNDHHIEIECHYRFQSSPVTVEQGDNQPSCLAARVPG
jgi:hypothetical protein